VSSEPDQCLLLAADSIELRRTLGATAWMVFEELLLGASATSGGWQSAMSVRTLAARLGLAKDTVARALNRLRRAGLVTPIQSRTTTGVFASGRYELAIPESITIRVSRQTTRSIARSHTRPVVTQLALAIDA
jgi:DNA-binding IclR family transcriptional regulator